MAVERTPHKPALVEPGQEIEYTYEEWYDRIVTVASALKSMGIGTDDRVCTVMENRPQLASLYWSTQLIGATFVPINFRASIDELAYLLNLTEPQVVFYSAVSQDEMKKVVDRNVHDPRMVFVGNDTPDNTIPYSVFQRLATEGFEPTWVNPAATSIILHTSGTTGYPKGVPRSHFNTYAASLTHASSVNWNQEESVMGSMSLFHTMGFHTMTTTALLNGKWVCEHFKSPEQTLAYIENETATALHMVPTAYHDLVKCDATTGYDFSHVQKVSYGGFNVSETLKRMILDLFEPDFFVNHYGSTEVYTHTVCDSIERKLRCAGQARTNTRVRVIRITDGDNRSPNAIVDQGDFGEIIVDMSSPEAASGYLDQTDNEENMNDGWFFTGDLGYRGKNGNLYVVSRRDDMILSGGENIYPVEIENIIEKHDDVNEVAVVGLEHEKWNQAITAFVYLKQDPYEQPVDFEALAADFDKYLRESDELANFKRPRKYIFVDEIIKSNVGKILRRELRKSNIDVTVYDEVTV